MDSSTVLYLGRYTLETALLLSAPILVVCTLVGLAVSILQAVTSIRDNTLSTVPKLLAVGLTTLMFGGWMLDVITKFTLDIFSYIQKCGH